MARHVFSFVSASSESARSEHRNCCVGWQCFGNRQDTNKGRRWHNFAGKMGESNGETDVQALKPRVTSSPQSLIDDVMISNALNVNHYAGVTDDVIRTRVVPGPGRERHLADGVLVAELLPRRNLEDLVLVRARAHLQYNTRVRPAVQHTGQTSSTAYRSDQQYNTQVRPAVQHTGQTCSGTHMSDLQSPIPILDRKP